MKQATKNREKLADLALDLTQDFPRSPRCKLAGHVIAARTLDKCRADLNDSNGEYHFNCPLDRIFFDFTGISGDDFRGAVAEGRSDDEMADWIKQHAKDHSEEEIVQWNNDLRYKRISEMDGELQVFLEGYIDDCLPAGRVVHHWFDVYDIEENRL
jgi:hypothetical protein